MYFCGGKSNFESERKTGNTRRKINVPTIFNEKIANTNNYRYEARLRFRKNLREYYRHLGETLRHFRVRAGMSQDDLSKYLGFNASKIANLEDGAQNGEIGLMLLDEFCTIVGTDVNTFLEKFRENRNSSN